LKPLSGRLPSVPAEWQEFFEARWRRMPGAGLQARVSSSPTCRKRCLEFRELETTQICLEAMNPPHSIGREVAARALQLDRICCSIVGEDTDPETAFAS
jgi:hypothetical protein